MSSGGHTAVPPRILAARLVLSVNWALAVLMIAAAHSTGQTSASESPGGEEPTDTTDSEVRIVRRLPESGEHTTRATWTPPSIPPAEVAERVEPEPPRLSGRLALGSAGGVDTDGAQRIDATADSRLTLVQPLGSGAALEVQGEGRRSVTLGAERESYGGGVGLTGGNAEVGVSGRYDRAFRFGEDFDEEAEELEAELSGELLHLETLPITLGAFYRSGEASEEDARVELVEEYRGELAAEGTIGSAEVEAGARAEHKEDDERDYAITTVGADAGVILSPAERIALSPSVASTGSRTAYEETAASLETLTLETDLGVAFAPTEEWELRVVPGAVNVWASQSGDIPEDDEASDHTWTLRGRAGADYASESGGSTGAEYTVSKTLAGVLSQRAVASAEWRTPAEETAPVDSLLARMSLGFTDDAGGAPLSREHIFGVATGLVPTETLEIDGRYDGSYAEGEETVSSHGGSLSYRHAPWPALSYGNGAAVAATRTTAEADGLEQVYSGNVELTPHLGGGRPSLGLSERYLIRDGAEESEQLSSLSSRLAVPIGRPLRLRYAFGWDNYRSGGPVGNTYSHEAGAGIAAGTGSTVTSSFTYRYSHGDRPERHDVRTALEVRFGEGFSVEGEFEWSRYKEDGDREDPFVGSLLFARSF